MYKHIIQNSKFLSYVLRHQPQSIGIALDTEGWVAVDELLAAAAQHGQPISREQLDAVVASNNKQRFCLSEDGLRIRANQGHSVEVDLNLVAIEPPELLYHGTVDRFLASIRAQGLVRGKRHHVHLSADRDTALRVGQRRGKPVVLVVEAGRMHRDGHTFYRSENGVWLTEAVPPEYLQPRNGDIEDKSKMIQTRTIYRPVGLTELELIRASGMRRFPPRLPEQPIFYPVLNREYAQQIAEVWNTRNSSGEACEAGFVTAFDLPVEYLDRFEEHVVGSSMHRELWIPAEQLDEFNGNIIGSIRVTDVFYGDDCAGPRYAVETSEVSPTSECSQPRSGGMQ